MKSFCPICPLLATLLPILLLSCSTQKNTRATRAYHAMTTRYNIYFNGNNAFQEGLNAINQANQDDYSTVLPLYPVSNHEAAKASGSQMDRTIEKCRKCIKLHSIKSKPKPDPKRRNDPKYKLFMQQEEYNPRMGDAWLLLGKAEFHKGDFLGSVGTFNYIIRHYQTDKDMVAQCQLWVVRAYAEMGWLYEAEELLQKVNQDDLSRRHAALYSATTADLRLKNGQYREALPFVKLALSDEKGVQKTRFHYIIGQLAELQADRDGALAAYKRVNNLNPSAEMDFNARLRRTILSSDTRSLKKMARQYKNKDRLDYIYGALGDIALQKGDTAAALENYALAAEKSTQGGMQKAAVLVRAGDIRYERCDYAGASPCYTEASSILPATHADYPRVKRRAETLDLLIAETGTINLQDSLQRLSHMTEEEQLAVAEKIIADLEKAEKEAAEKAAQAARDAANDQGLQSVNTQNMIGGTGGNGEWYFYNPQLIRQGRQDFNRRWGQRTLEDNWRRAIKSVSSSFGGALAPDEASADSLATDSVGSNAVQLVTDVKNPQYYLQQIPRTEAELAASDSLIATALYNLVFIYHDKVEDPALTAETISEMERRFPTDQRLAEVWFMQYLTCLKQENTKGAELWRRKILQNFPNSRQAQIVGDPNYFERLGRMQQEQDSLYEAAYTAYRHSDFSTVKQARSYAEEAFPLSPLMPRFLFLDAVAAARTENQEAFINRLRGLVERYPESEPGAMAKDMLAMMNQGMESQTGDNSSLLDKRAQQQEDIDSTLLEKNFSADRTQRTFVMLAVKSNEQTLNKLLYEVALFNFSQFLIKDFDLKIMPQFYLGTGALQVSGFETYDEALWYSSLMKDDAGLQRLFSELGVDVIRINEDNLPLLNTRFTLEEYRSFQKENNLE